MAKDGRDDWSGKLQSPNATKTDGPLLTIGKATEILTAGDTCFIRKGVYRETIKPAHSGDSIHQIVFTNYGNEKVVISGCDKPDQPWMRFSGTIYKTSLKKLSNKPMVFIDGALAPEARWPNNSGDLLRPSFASVADGTYQSVTHPDLPAGANLKGARLYGFFGKEWALQIMTITGYDPSKGILSFQAPERRQRYYSGASGWDKNYAPRKDNRFYLAGNFDLMDADREWFYSESDTALFLNFENGSNPVDRLVEIKVRDYAIDLSGRSNIVISGLEIFGAGITSDSLTSRCIIRKVNAYHVDPGIFVNGTANEVNSGEFAFCAKGIMQIDGKRHRIVNNYIHDGNYTGTWDQLLSTDGWGHLVSHNTVSGSGGGCIGPGGKNMRFSHNHVFDAGLIRHDVGGFYVANNDGANTVINHNRVHDVYGIGIYLDNSTSNYTIHHNVVWNCGWEYILSEPPPSFLSIEAYDAIRLNTPGNFNRVYNNTCYNSWGLGYWGRNFKEDMYGDHIINNIFTGFYRVANGVVSSHNIHEKVNPRLQDPEKENFQLTANSPAIDSALPLASITGDHKNNLPDCGAYEYGEKPWKAGHDFDHMPTVQFETFTTDYINLVKNGSFENGLKHWEKVHTDEVEIINENSWGIENANTRMQQQALVLENGGDGVRQLISGLKTSGNYTLSGWLKVSAIDQPAEIAVYFSNEKKISKSINTTKWEFIDLDFTVTNDVDTIFIGVNKTGTGSGNVYCDDIGLIEKFNPNPHMVK
ncbi:right-handed parallel beta-helix repeat-containing protein [Fulvivirgaceae bacterium BMA12]|uniref:Right-handed parallel beta-helix repeat-containing protein n=1 Tax=Agaribacillus aureus TaxID=3051825 RepID=A0ABT8LCN1_9BACT|nr:right-handed parallel beta-helix repeat-containing protein [Fulvivirgaceae bacterium BMA12]